MKSILITTKHRGVFFGQVPADKDLTTSTLTDIENARMAIQFGTTRGVMQLAESGPTKNSKIGAACKINVLHDITGVFECSAEATEKWMSA
jgi:hypothetical protein